MWELGLGPQVLWLVGPPRWGLGLPRSPQGRGFLVTSGGHCPSPQGAIVLVRPKVPTSGGERNLPPDHRTCWTRWTIAISVSETAQASPF